MGRVLLGAIVAVASVILVDSLSCNSCSVSLLGFCLNSGTVTCSSNTSVCFTGELTFPSLSSFDGITRQGCREPAGCNATANQTVLNLVTIQTTIQCCSSDRCNPVTLSAAPPTRTTLTAALGAAVLASVWGSML